MNQAMRSGIETVNCNESNGASLYCSLTNIFLFDLAVLYSHYAVILP